LARFPSSPVTATTRPCARMIVFAFVEICMFQESKCDAITWS
jgi:hypothetical protein